MNNDQILHAECALIGSVLMDSQILLEVGLQPSDFTERNSVIWAAILALSDTGDDVDEVTVSSKLHADGMLATVGGTQYIATLSDYTGSAGAYPTYAKLVVKAAKKRELVRLGKQIATQAEQDTGDPDDIAAMAESSLIKLYDQQDAVLVDSRVAMRDVYVDLDNTIKHGRKTGVLTGFSGLDEITGGLHPGTLTYIAARPGAGKTAFAFCAGLNAAFGINDQETKKVAAFSLEMSTSELIYRQLSSTSRVKHRDIMRGNVNMVDMKDIARAAAKIAEAPFWICDKCGITPSELRMLCKQQQNRHGLDLVIIDYIQLMKLGGRVHNRNEEVGEISRQFKLLAKDLNIPVIVLSQLNRMSENRADKRPQVSDMRESGNLEQDADLILLIYRQEMHEPRNPAIKGKAEIIVGKNRHGVTGVVEVSSQLEYMRFADLQDDRYENCG